MSFFSTISKAIYREYDRRIKRASLVTEYGASHHTHAHDEHEEAEYEEAGHAEAEHEEHAEAEYTDADEGAEIVNVPPGTPVEQAKHE
jgi:uncharacterized RmlC-like cupin family protein